LCYGTPERFHTFYTWSSVYPSRQEVEVLVWLESEERLPGDRNKGAWKLILDTIIASDISGRHRLP
jgi:hypothetical protein